MVTHTWNLCSTFNPSKVHTHSSEHTHTLQTHTRSSGQPFLLWHPGSSWGFGALLKGTSVVVLKVERALYIHSPHLQFLPAWDSNSQPFNYKSDSLTIRHDIWSHMEALNKLHFFFYFICLLKIAIAQIAHTHETALYLDNKRLEINC